MEEKTQKFHHVVKTVVLVQKNKTGIQTYVAFQCIMVKSSDEDDY